MRLIHDDTTGEAYGRLDRLARSALIPLGQVPDGTWDDLSTLKELTCVNHPTARYLTKNPWTRSLHFVQAAEGFDFTECPCPFSDLRVIQHSL